MTGEIERDDWTYSPAEHSPTDSDRYTSVAVDHEESIIYDREIEGAWIQSDSVAPLDEWQ